MTLEHDEAAVRQFEALITKPGKTRIQLQHLWEAFLTAFPGRDGPSARTELERLLRVCETRGSLQLPKTPSSYDSSILPPLPRFVIITEDELPAPQKAWKERAWHPKLDWIADLSHLSAGQYQLLDRVHKGLVEGWFSQHAPTKYRSLQLTGHEKRLELYRTTSLFGPGRLTLEMLGCTPDAHPMAIAKVSASPSLLIVENAGAFHVACQVLRSLTDPPYGAVAFGGGNRLSASVPSLTSEKEPFEYIHYLGDLDWEGLSIALRGNRAAVAAGLPELAPPKGLYEQMVETAGRFGAPTGWPGGRTIGASDDRDLLLRRLPQSVRKSAANILDAGHRIPEEILGPNELQDVWRG